MNSVKHSFFAKVLHFETEDQENEYRELADGIHASLRPSGTMEELEVEEIATQRWHLRKCQQLIQQQLAGYEKPHLDPQVAKFIKQSSLPEVPIPGLLAEKGGAQAISPWEVRELIAVVTNDQNSNERKDKSAAVDLENFDFSNNDKGGSQTTQEGNRFHIQVKLGQSLDTLLKYENTIQKRLDRALERLLKLQELRRESRPE